MTQHPHGFSIGENDIAIIGMAARLPGAEDVSVYWNNLVNGIESIRPHDEAALLAAGESPQRIARPDYVPAGAPLEGFADFDAEFFGFSPREAAIMDPQHRVFLETAWSALENAGHTPERFKRPIGVFAGCGMGSYFYFNLCSHPDLVEDVGLFLLRHTGNDKDFLSTRVSHILDLHGPSVNVQTACSTSLVAVHYAAQSLLGGECDMALAGGVTIELPQGRGYIFKEGEILSPDGHCHAFDHRAQGTVFGSGAGAVVLRRLADAIADGDHIWAVIKGSAVNNDGADKAGYLAPSVEGQARAIAEAQAVAGVAPDSIGYVECHGTGTYLGDPIEVAALTQAFREGTDKADFCRIGSVKSNIGHLDTAAGVASLIKATLAVNSGQIPPSLNYEAPNPAIAFDGSPFAVNDRLSDWPLAMAPRRAGVNSLGVGGTNAHAVIEQPPAPPASAPGDWPFALLTLSARSTAALDGASTALATHLRAHPEQPLDDIAWTLQTGRRAFDTRRVVVAETHAEAAALLESGDPRRVFTHTRVGDAPEVVFMFPGGGAQYAGMARDLYETEPVFRDWMDRGLDHLGPKLDHDLRALWLPEPDARAHAEAQLRRPSVQLPLIAITEYALAQLFLSWGISPKALVGHSMGENVAACLAGVMRFEDCIGLVHLRGQLFDEIAPGGMLSVALPHDDLAARIGDDLDIASVNAPGLTVVSGPDATLRALETKLRAQEIEVQRVAIDIAAHSRMLEPILERFGDYLRQIPLAAPQIPVVSNRTGTWLTDAQATDPAYWVAHLRNTVRFKDCLATLSDTPARVYLEMGPGKALSSLAQAQALPGITRNQVINTLRHPDQDMADDLHFMGILGRLWATGVPIDWGQIWGETPRRRVPLPGYAFQRKRYFIEPAHGVTAAQTAPPRPTRAEDIADWGWRPQWRPRAADSPVALDEGLEPETIAARIRTEVPPVIRPEAGAESAPETGPETWLVFCDDAGLAQAAIAPLRSAGHNVIELHAGDRYARITPERYTLAPERGREGYDALIRDLVAHGTVPTRIAHFWLVTTEERFRPGGSFFHRNLEQGFYSLLFLAQAIGSEGLPMPLHLSVFTSGAQALGDTPLRYPEKATVMGPARVIPREFPGLTCSVLDLALPTADPAGGRLRRRRTGRNPAAAALPVATVLEEMLATPANGVAAWHGGRRYALGFRPHRLEARGRSTDHEAQPLGPRGAVWVITGGFGGIGLTVAERLIRETGARIALLTRQPLPPRDSWDEWLRRADPDDPVARRLRAVARLEAAGGELHVACADICNIEQMRAALDGIRKQWGDPYGLIQAAGVIDDQPILGKSAASVEQVLAPKLHGTQVIDQLLPDGALQVMVLFSSSSTVTAPAGQVDYVAANEYLNAFARARQGGKTRVIAINWGLWSGLGMAAEALARRLGHRPPEPPLPLDGPLLDSAGHDAAGHRLFTARLSAGDHWILDEHRSLDGTPVLPGTGYLELAAQAWRAQGETGPFEIRDLYFFRPVTQDDAAAPRDLRLSLQRSDEGYTLALHSDHRLAGRAGYVLNAQGTLAPFNEGRGDKTGNGRATGIDPAMIAARLPDARTPPKPSDTLPSPQEDRLRFGPRWQVLRRAALGTDEGLALLELPKGAATTDMAAGYLLHPALLDIATGWALPLVPGYSPDDLWVPISYGCLRAHAPLAPRILSWVRPARGQPSEPGFARFDITLADENGHILVEIADFAMKRLDARAGLGRQAAPGPGEVIFPDEASVAGRPLSPEEERLRENLQDGIRPEEGAEAFARTLVAGQPQIVVSALDLDGLNAQTEDSAGALPGPQAGSGAGFERPDLGRPIVVPRNDIERTLAGFWQDLLGLSEVGVEDNFFDLGGHSLIAVRLFAQVRKAYRVDFPISVLFEAPTIAACAALIAERIGPQDAASSPDDSTADAPGDSSVTPVVRRRFTHLVAMHEGEGGRARPFFLVAGMFGNVLNLRHLAQLLGHDRPFYGLQARGLFGDAPPHRDLTEAAADYIAELRQVQPRGPYLLGGFSGGGITAYEMARQLEAAGQEVAALVLLDTPLPQREPLRGIDRARIKAQQLRAAGPGYLRDWARDRLAWELGKLRRQIAPPETRHNDAFHNAEIEAAFRAAIGAYRLAPWPGNLVLFRPPLERRWRAAGGRWISSGREYVMSDNGWTEWAPKTRVIEVPGDHDSMVLEPNVRVLAAQIRQVIETADTDQTTTPQNARAAE